MDWHDAADLALALRRLMASHDLVVIRAAAIDDAQLTDIGRQLGSGCSEVKRFVVEGPTGSIGQSRWHHVGNLVDGKPCDLTLMSVREFPSQDGEFELVSNRRSWRALEPAVQERLRGLNVEHDFTSVRHTTARADDPSRKGMLQLVWDAADPHVVLGFHAAQVIGMTTASSKALLEALMTAATLPQHVYRHAWQAGDLIAWRNLPLMHRSRGFNVPGRRVIHEVQVRDIAPGA
ncbi:TauD/TfdA dioxygenase family protein [Roseateles toxinivorans]|nr:TauD/TfdA family dioxygenase [Roseateles toxinivorans]